MAISVATTTRLRSRRSASTPPHRPKTINGTISTAPRTPTATYDPVISAIWKGIDT